MARLPTTIDVDGVLSIPAHEIEVTTARSGGPGGQHVNKTETKVVLRWNPGASGALDDAQRERLLARLASRLTTEGDLLVSSERHRDQGRNVDDAVTKLVETLRAALRRPKARRKTRPSPAQRRRRLDAKKRRGEVKRQRGRVEPP